jgi:hypothetical protein
MTVTELHSMLKTLISEGKGNLTICLNGKAYGGKSRLLFPQETKTKYVKLSNQRTPSLRYYMTTELPTDKKVVIIQ